MRFVALTCLISFVFYASFTHASNSSRWSDIAELSDVWAIGHYFSPDIACDTDNWDTSFVDSLEKIEAGRITLSQAKIIFSISSDSYIFRKPQQRYILGQKLVPDSSNKISDTTGIAIARINSSLDAEETAKWMSFQNNRLLVLDLRSNKMRGILDLVSRSSVFENPHYLKILGKGIDKLPPVESISYTGLPSEGTFSTGYFNSALVESSADQEREISQLQSTVDKELVILGNANTYLPRSLLAARLNGKATFITTDSSFSYGGLASTNNDPQSKNPSLLLARYKDVDLKKALSPDFEINESCASNDTCLKNFIETKNVKPRGDFQSSKSCSRIPSLGSPSMINDMYPKLSYRLFGVAKIYQVLRLFHPQPDLLGSDLRQRYELALQEAASAKTAEQYVMSIARFISPIRDGHAELLSMSYFNAFGVGDLPVKAFAKDGNIYVGCNSDKAATLRAGSVVISIDGQKVVDRINHLTKLKITPAGSSSAEEGAKFIFRGAVGSQIDLEIIDPNNNTSRVSMMREQTERCNLPWSPRSGEAIQWMKEDVAYINLSTATSELIEKSSATLSKARAILIDARGASNGAAWSIAAHLSKEEKINVGKFITPIIQGRLLDDSQYRDASVESRKIQWIFAGAKPFFPAKVVVMIDSRTVSQAEHSVLLIKAATAATTVGSKTAGSLGDVTRIILPGNVAFQFSGQAVETLQGKRVLGQGIDPDVEVIENLSDLVNNRDPVLERAITLTD